MVSRGFCGASREGVALTIGTAGGAVADGWRSLASASTVRVETANTPAASARDEAPATSHIRSDGFEFALLEFRRFTICPFYQLATSASNCCQDRYEEILSKMARYSGFFPFKSLPLNSLQIAPNLVQFAKFFCRTNGFSPPPALELPWTSGQAAHAAMAI